MKSLTTFIHLAGKDFLVEYFFYKEEKEIELIAIDNVSYLEDVYNDIFLDLVQANVLEHELEGNDSDYSGAFNSENGR